MLRARLSIDAAVRQIRRQRPRTTRKPSFLGDGILERARSTSLALLGLAAAVGLGTIALAINQDWPLIAGSPIPAAPEPVREDASDAKSADERSGVGPANGRPSHPAPAAAIGDEDSADQASPPSAPLTGGITASLPVDGGPDRSDGKAPDPSPQQPQPNPQPLPVSRPQAEQPAPTPRPAPVPSSGAPDAPVTTASDEDEDDDDGDEDDWDSPRDRGRGHDDDWDHGHGHGHGWDDDD